MPLRLVLWTGEKMTQSLVSLVREHLHDAEDTRRYIKGGTRRFYYNQAANILHKLLDQITDEATDEELEAIIRANLLDLEHHGHKLAKCRVTESAAVTTEQIDGTLAKQRALEKLLDQWQVIQASQG